MKGPPCINPPDYAFNEIAAFQALAGGTASEGQQKMVLDWIINGAANTYDLSFDPESDRNTSFAEGRRFVGLQIVKMLNLDRSKFKEK